jgi:hypothetical protein
MVATGRRYRNCLSSSFEILHVLAGRSFHYVDEPRGLIVTLQSAGYRRHSPAWVVSTIFGPDNTPPSPRVQRDILGDLNRYGIGREGDREPDPEPIAILRRAASSLDRPTIELIIAEMDGSDGFEVAC